MRAKERFYAGSDLERVRAEIRRARRAEKVWTVLTVLTLLALAALCGWLWSCVTHASGQTLRLGDLETGSLLAVAPVTKGAAMGLLAFGLLMLVWAAVRKVNRDREFFASLRREEDVFAPLRESGLPVSMEDAQRILVACAAEGREIQRLVLVSLTTLSLEDYEASLEIAHDRLTTLVTCVEALCERLQPCIAGGEPETVVLGKKGGREV